MENQKQEEQIDKVCTCRYVYDALRNKWILKEHCKKHDWTVMEYQNSMHKEVNE